MVSPPRPLSTTLSGMYIEVPPSYLFIHLFIYLFICLFIYLFIYLFFDLIGNGICFVFCLCIFILNFLMRGDILSARELGNDVGIEKKKKKAKPHVVCKTLLQRGFNI